MNLTHSLKTLCTGAVFCGFSVAASAVELSLIRGTFENGGVDLDAAGVVHSNFTPGNAKLHARLRGLTPGASYQFTVDGVNEADLVADDNGRTGVFFRVVPEAAQLPLDFDPRGHLLAVNDGSADVLSMVYSGANEPDGISVDERTALQRAEGVTVGRVEVRYLKQKKQSRFVVHLHDLDSGAYTLSVAGEPKAEIALETARSAKVTFRAKPRAHVSGRHSADGNGSLVLDFDPRGELIELAKDGVVVFSGEMLAQVPGINADLPEVSETVLISTGADEDATATAELKATTETAREFSVEVHNLPAGAYSLVIGGVERGTITVAETEGGTEGEIGFFSDAEEGELLLDFDPSGESIEVRQGETTFFTGTINGLPAADEETPAETL